jgi:flagellin
VSLTINTNRSAMTAHRNLMSRSRRFNQSIRRLSSGLRINSAADNPAGMAIRENMKAQQGGMRQALRNTNDGVGMLNIAESGLQSISDIYIRMRELAVQSANDSVSDTERTYLDTEFQDLKDEVTRVSSATEYNGITLLDGLGNGNSTTAGGGFPPVAGFANGTLFANFSFQVGTRNNPNNRIQASIAEGVFGDVAAANVTSLTDSQGAIDILDDALDQNNHNRARIGSTIRSLNTAADFLSSAIMNYGESISQIADTDMAEESSVFAREQVLRQAGVAMLAQANQQPNLVLRLLG